jgi:hypothetical protein
MPSYLHHGEEETEMSTDTEPQLTGPSEPQAVATKGASIALYYGEHPEATRREVAEAVGCTVGRVGEVIRAGLTAGVGAARGGSTKGQAILDYFSAHGPSTRREAAEAVGCTVGRVGEVLRANLSTFEQTRPGMWAATAPDGTAAPVETRQGRCEHEKRRKTKAGSCKVCPPLV